MPKTTKAPKPTANGTVKEGVTPEVMTLAEAAEFLRFTVPVVQRLALSGRLPGRVAEGEWRFLRSALKVWLAGTDFAKSPEPVSHLSSKEKLLAVAGSLADDDSLEAMVEEIYRERKRHPIGGNS